MPHRLNRSIRTAALVAAVAFSVVVPIRSLQAQDDEGAQGSNPAQANVGLVNQINALQSQIQQLQGRNEELQHQLDQLKQQNKDQYVDLDSRIGRIEGRAAGQGGSPVAPATPANNGVQQDLQLGEQGGAPPAPTGAAAPAPPPNPADEKAAYDQAFNALKNGSYAESAQKFQGFVNQYPTSELAPNAYYWLGESYYVTQNYPISLNAFNTLLAKYPNSQKAAGALLKIGYCEYELKQWDQAEATLNQVVQKYPGTQEANLAQGRLRALRLERR